MILSWFVEAKIEFAEAAQYYYYQDSGLDLEFIEDVSRAINVILEDPFRHREFDPPYRKLSTKRFPFQIIYAMEGENILIVAVMHQSRDPEYWKDRK